MGRFLGWFFIGAIVASLAIFALPVLAIVLIGLFVVRALSV